MPSPTAPGASKFGFDSIILALGKDGEYNVTPGYSAIDAVASIHLPEQLNVPLEPHQSIEEYSQDVFMSEDNAGLLHQHFSFPRYTQISAIVNLDEQSHSQFALQQSIIPLMDTFNLESIEGYNPMSIAIASLDFQRFEELPPTLSSNSTSKEAACVYSNIIETPNSNGATSSEPFPSL